MYISAFGLFLIILTICIMSPKWDETAEQLYKAIGVLYVVALFVLGPVGVFILLAAEPILGFAAGAVCLFLMCAYVSGRQNKAEDERKRWEAEKEDNSWLYEPPKKQFDPYQALREIREEREAEQAAKAAKALSDQGHS